MPCACCKPVNFVCFWEPRRPAAWKRPALFGLGAAIVASLGVLLWVGPPQLGPFLEILCAGLIVAGLLGLVVAVRGCDACVARCLG